MIDRPLRPLFPEGYNNETQVIGLLLSADLENDSDTLAITGRLHGPLPLRHPLPRSRWRAVRVGYWDGQFVVNPTSTELRTKSKLNLLVAGTDDAIVMVESGAAEISEDEMVQALTDRARCHQEDRGHPDASCRARPGKPKRTFTPKTARPRLRDLGRAGDERAAARRPCR